MSQLPLTLWVVIVVFVVVSATCRGLHLVRGDNDLVLANLELAEKPQVADLKRFEPSFQSSNGSKKELKVRKKLVVATILEPPFVMFKKDSYQIAGNERFEGFLVDLLRHFSQSLNFDYEIRLASDNKYGTIYVNRFWDGIIGMIHRKEADIAMGPIVITNIMKKFVDLTQPLLTLRYSALISKSKPEDTKDGLEEELIADVSQLLASGIPCGVVRDSLVHQMLNNSSQPVHRAILTKIADKWPEYFVDSRQEGVARARSENYAFIVDTPIAEYEAGKQPCDLYTTEPFLDLVEYALALSREVVYESEDGLRTLKEAMDEEISNLKKGDDMQAMYLHWWKDECSSRKRKNKEETDADYQVIEWNEHKGQKSSKAKKEGYTGSLQGRSGPLESVSHQEPNYHLYSSKIQQQNGLSRNSSDAIVIFFLLMLITL